VQLLSPSVCGYNPAHEVDFYVIIIFLYQLGVDGPENRVNISTNKQMEEDTEIFLINTRLTEALRNTGDRGFRTRELLSSDKNRTSAVSRGLGSYIRRLVCTRGGVRHLAGCGGR
jgi:hypothetical protein